MWPANGFVQPEGSILSRTFGKERDPDDYRFDERPVYAWPPVDPAYSGFSWLSQAEVAAVAERDATVPYAWDGKVIYEVRRNAEIDAVAAMIAALDRGNRPSRFVFWFEDQTKHRPARTSSSLD